MKYSVIVIIVSVGIILSHSCDAYEYVYDQDESDLKWLYDNHLYGQGFGKFAFNEDFDDYVPSSYRKSVHYPPILTYHPSTYYYDSGSQLDDQWNEEPPIYLTYKTLPRIQKKPVSFVSPSTEQPPSPSGNGYHYPTPESTYLPPSRRPIVFPPSRKPDTPKSVYLPPATEYLPPTRKPTRATPKTTIKPTTTTTSTSTKPSTPQSLYLPPIVVAEPTIDSDYLPPPPELAHHLQPPPLSRAKPILFN